MVDVVLLHCKQFKAAAPSKMHDGDDVGDEVFVNIVLFARNCESMANAWRNVCPLILPSWLFEL